MSGFDPQRSVIDSINWINQAIDILRRLGSLLEPMGDLAPPCAAVPYMEAREEIANLIVQWRTRARPEIANPEVLDNALSALDEKMGQVPVLTQMWTDAPPTWQVPSVPRPTAGSAMSGWSDFWRSVGDAAVDAGAGALITIGAVAGSPAVIVGGSAVLVTSGVLQAYRGDPGVVGTQTKWCSDLTARVALKFHGRTLPSIYQQMLAVYMLGRAKPDKDTMREFMTRLNPYDLPTMPPGWNGTFAHVQSEKTEGASWFLALLVGGLVGLGTAVVLAED